MYIKHTQTHEILNGLTTNLLLIHVEHEKALGHSGTAAARLPDRFGLQKVLLEQLVRIQFGLFGGNHGLPLDLLLFDVVLRSNHSVNIKKYI